MVGIMDLFQQISTSVKLGWIVCLVWAVVQIAWYRRARLDRERSRVWGRRRVVGRCASRLDHQEALAVGRDVEGPTSISTTTTTKGVHPLEEPLGVPRAEGGLGVDGDHHDRA